MIMYLYINIIYKNKQLYVFMYIYIYIYINNIHVNIIWHRGDWIVWLRVPLKYVYGELNRANRARTVLCEFLMVRYILT